MAFIGGDTAKVSNSSTVTVSYHADAVAGDVAMLFVVVDGTDQTLTCPSGYVEIKTVAHSTSFASHQMLCRRVLDGTEGASVTVSVPSDETVVACLDIFRGIDNATPEDNEAQHAEGTSTSPTAPAVATQTDGATLYCAVGVEDAGNINLSTPTSMTTCSSAIQGLGGSGSELRTAFEEIATAGDTGTRTFPSDSTRWVAISVPLKAATSSGGGDGGGGGGDGGGGGGGGGTVINVVGAQVTTEQMGLSPTSDPVLGAQRLQTFMDNCATDRVHGIIEAGFWAVDKTIQLHDGIKIGGRGMNLTIIEGIDAAWSGGRSVLYLSSNNGQNVLGVHLHDLCAIGSDKNKTRNGNTIQLRATNDFTIERIKATHGSDACIRADGYNSESGSFDDNIHGPVWNNSYRGVIRDCLAEDGYLGIEVEGGAESVLVQHNYMRNQQHIACRLSGGWFTDCVNNYMTGAGNGAIYMGRHKNCLLGHNRMLGNTRGVVIRGFDHVEDGEITKNLRIHGNDILATGGPCITDAYQGSAGDAIEGMSIIGNNFAGGDIRLFWTRKVFITGNTGDGTNRIYPSDSCTGLVHHNAAPLNNQAAGVIDGGFNQNVPGF